MALVYRVIPIPEASYIESGCIAKNIQTLEKQFYDLGYINFSKADPCFRLNVSGENINTFDTPDCETKAFFLFPLDALRASVYIQRGYYTNKFVWLCEYDIPDEILKKYLGFGYYNESPIAEFQIPINELCNLETVKEECDESMLDDLKNACYDSVSDFCDTCIISPDYDDERAEKIRNVLVAKLPNRFESRIEKMGKFAPTNIITGRCFINDRDKYWKYEDGTLIANSNGILTDENIAEYNEYFKDVENMYSYEKKEYIIKRFLSGKPTNEDKHVLTNKMN